MYQENLLSLIERIIEGLIAGRDPGNYAVEATEYPLHSTCRVQ